MLRQTLTSAIEIVSYNGIASFRSSRNVFLTSCLTSIRFVSTVSPTRSTTPIPPVVERHSLKKADSRKTFLIDKYTSLLRKNPIVLVFHSNTLLKRENSNMRAQILKAGGKLNVVRSGIFKVALRGIEHEDPASVEAHKLYRKKGHPLSEYFYGPTAVISFPEISPVAVQSVLKVLDKSGDQLMLLGGLIDGQMLDKGNVYQFKQLPSIEQIRADLAGVLTILGGAGLVQTLETSSKILYLTLEERCKQFNETKE